MSKRELPIPPRAIESDPAFELLRVWIADGDQHVSLSQGVWEDPAAWGIMLVDLARHVANAYTETEGMQRSEVLDRIKEGFDAEWSAPTDESTGDV